MYISLNKRKEKHIDTLTLADFLIKISTSGFEPEEMTLTAQRKFPYIDKYRQSNRCR